MKPYYEDDFVTLYHADCLEYPELWTCADVLVTDPPYGMKHSPRGAYDPETGRTSPPLGANKVAGDATLDVRNAVLNMWGDRPQMVFGTWRQPRPERVDHRLIWWKQGQAPGPLRASFMLQDEEIYVTGKGFLATSPPKRSVFATNESRSTEVITIGHPTPKPVDLMEWLLEACQPEWVVADPFAGSGSTLVAAKRLGRKAIGVELEERYCEIAANRLAQEILPLWEGGTA